MKARPGIWLVALGILAVALAGCTPCGLAAAVARQAPPASQPAAGLPAPLPEARSSLPNVGEQEQLLVDLYKRANPAVVNVQVTKRSQGSFRFDPQQGEPPDEFVHGQGSGFVIDRQGHIVTNHHVVEGAEEVLVVYADGDEARGEVIGSDADSDLAVIKADHLPAGVAPLELSDTDQVEVGQAAIAIGNPFGLQGTLTTGIVSAVGRTLPLGRESSSIGGRFSIPRMIQTDAAINPGNSGGPLLDSRGRVIGINTAINAQNGVNSGVGFAVPVSLIRRVVPRLIQEGRYVYPWLGISGRDVTPDIADAMNLPSRRGALIVEVVKSSPAERAGLRSCNRTVTAHDTELQVGGDVITAIDDQPVRQFDDLLVYLIENASVGQTIRLTIIRDGRPQVVPVTLAERPTD